MYLLHSTDYRYGNVELRRRLLTVVMYMKDSRIKLQLSWMLPLVRSEKIPSSFFNLIHDRFLPQSFQLIFLIIPPLDTIEKFVPKYISCNISNKTIQNSLFCDEFYKPVSSSNRSAELASFVEKHSKFAMQVCSQLFQF